MNHVPLKQGLKGPPTVVWVSALFLIGRKKWLAEMAAGRAEATPTMRQLKSALVKLISLTLATFTIQAKLALQTPKMYLGNCEVLFSCCNKTAT